MSYQGWENYATWLVILWLNNDERSQRYMEQLALEAWADAGQEKRPAWDRAETALFALKDKLREYLDLQRPEMVDPGMYGDLLTAAIESVDCLAIADAYLEGFVPEYAKAKADAGPATKEKG